MGDIYRVVVTREGAETDDVSVIVELAAPAEVLARFAPAAVASVLGSTIEGDTPTAPEAGNYGPGQPKQRRPRRAKAEMEATRAGNGEVTVEVDPAPETEAPAYNPFGPK